MSLPSVHEDAALYVGYTTATLAGNVTSDGGHAITERGFYWATHGTPYWASTKVVVTGTTGLYYHNLSGLTPGTEYSFWAFATNSDGMTRDELSPEGFTTLAYVPTVSTVAISAITTTSAVSGGSGVSAGAGTISAKGVCWNTTGAPTTADPKTNEGTGTASYGSTLSGLTAGTTYFVRAYATNEYGTSYGAQVSFVACGPPTVGTVTPTIGIGANSATSGGNVTTDGGSAITDRGVCWATHTVPDLTDGHTHDGTGQGEYASAITGLTASTDYHVRAFATNARGTSYGGEVDFSTLAQSVTTAPVTEINHYDGTATCGGTTSAEPPEITAKGVVWSAVDATPSVDLATKTDEGINAGAFVSALTGLAADTLYYVRAYATRADASTIYGATVSFISTTHFTGAIGRVTVWAEALTADEVLADSQTGMQYFGRSLAKGTIVIKGMVENRKGALIPAHHVRAEYWIQNLEWVPDPTAPAPTLYIKGHSVDFAEKKNALTIGKDWMEDAIGVRMAELLATPATVTDTGPARVYQEADPAADAPTDSGSPDSGSPTDTSPADPTAADPADPAAAKVWTPGNPWASNAGATVNLPSGGYYDSLAADWEHENAIRQNLKAMDALQHPEGG